MVDVLGRGWSPTDRQYRVLRLSLAILLVTSQALVYVSGYGQPTYRYEAVEIQPGDARFDYDDDRVRFFEGFQGVDCYLDSYRSRLCLFERDLLDGNRTYERVSALYRPPEDEYTYHDGQFYERVQNGRDEEIVLGLRPVPAETVLDNVSTDYEHLERPLKRAVDGGTGTAHRDLEAHGRIVRYQGSYYAIYEVHSSEPKGYTASFFAVVAGFALLSRSLRIRMRR